MCGLNRKSLIDGSEFYKQYKGAMTEQFVMQELMACDAPDLKVHYWSPDGGDMEFVELDDENRVHLNLTGACGGCPMALMTLKMGIERYLKDACPEIVEVVQDNAKTFNEMEF